MRRRDRNWALVLRMMLLTLVGSARLVHLVEKLSSAVEALTKKLVACLHLWLVILLLLTLKHLK